MSQESAVPLTFDKAIPKGGILALDDTSGPTSAAVASP